MSQQTRHRGCLVFGIFWALLLIFTNVAFALGDCERDPDTGSCKSQSSLLRRSIIPAELLLLVVGGWIFYRRELRDGDY